MDTEIVHVCTTCRKKKPLSQFSIKPSGDPYESCKKHVNNPEFLIITWFQLEGLISSSLEIGRQMDLDYCIKLEDLPLQTPGFQEGLNKDIYRAAGRALMSILYEKFGIHFYLKNDVFGNNHWKGTFFCRECLESGRKPSDRIEKDHRVSKHQLRRQDCKGKVYMWVFRRNIRFFITHRHHHPAWSVDADRLLRSVMANPLYDNWLPSTILGLVQENLRQANDHSDLRLGRITSALREKVKRNSMPIDPAVAVQSLVIRCEPPKVSSRPFTKWTVASMCN